MAAFPRMLHNWCGKTSDSRLRDRVKVDSVTNSGVADCEQENGKQEKRRQAVREQRTEGQEARGDASEATADQVRLTIEID